jgi:hypothetical protein
VLRVLWPGTQAPLPGPEAVLIGLAALAVVMIPFLWPLANQLDTMAHEGAHAVVASVLGFTVRGVTLDRNSDGATGHAACVPWIAAVLLVLLLFLVRKSFGVVSVPAVIALLAVVIRYAHDGLEEVIIYAVTWLLLLSGARNAMAHGAGAGDADDLSRVTRLPRWLWRCYGSRARSWPSPPAENG